MSGHVVVSDEVKARAESPNLGIGVICSQCGKQFDMRACGPTHALIAAERCRLAPQLARDVLGLLEHREGHPAMCCGACHDAITKAEAEVVRLTEADTRSLAIIAHQTERAEKAETERDEARATKDMHKERYQQSEAENARLREALHEHAITCPSGYRAWMTATEEPR